MAVVVHDKEYWFDHKVFLLIYIINHIYFFTKKKITQLRLEDVAFVRGFSPAFIYDMGYTGMSENEVDAFTFGPMKQKLQIHNKFIIIVVK